MAIVFGAIVVFNVLILFALFCLRRFYLRGRQTDSVAPTDSILADTRRTLFV